MWVLQRWRHWQRAKGGCRNDDNQSRRRCRGPTLLVVIAFFLAAGAARSGNGGRKVRRGAVLVHHQDASTLLLVPTRQGLLQGGANDARVGCAAVRVDDSQRAPCGGKVRRGGILKHSLHELVRP
jgi:hypothetical protein